ncbi:LacI family DNA-binding transcriptional regulator [Microbacterium sp. NPDC087589]|uniref:LacI family DNA-binding transcriptional regulator n=1 Tax=Microbacterium sp. NPDC087589 TaxID=3364191 RepID=UPI00382C60D2
MKPVSLNDVALAAGVSIGTASRAMRNRGRVSPQTVEHVTAVAKRLGYAPNAIGRALREGSSSTIGMLVPHIENPFFAELIRAAESRLHDLGYQLIVGDSHADPSAEAERLRLLESRRVDGILVVPAVHDESAAAISETASRTPLVQLDRRAQSGIADFAGVDNVEGMRLVAKHLALIGSGSVLLVGTDTATTTGEERIAAFLESSTAFGLEVIGVHRHQFTIETGRDAVRSLADLPSAIVCTDDLIALGALGEIQRSGHRVPDHTQVTGFDGTVFANVVQPALTTVRQPLEAITLAAVDMLTRRISEGKASAPTDATFAPTLRVGGSTRSLSHTTTTR